MIKINRYRTEVVRADPKFKDFIKEVQATKMQKQKKLIPSSRITLAMFNQYNKYPDLLSELIGADLK